MTKVTGRLRFRDEFRDFWRFVKRPAFTPRLPNRAAVNGWWEDWFPSLSLWRLLQWAFCLWAVNLFFLGPIAIAAASLGGADHRFDINNIPWLQALIWAPVVEELVFRYGLRHVVQALWMVPVVAVALVFGPNWATVVLVAAVLLLCWMPYLQNMSSQREISASGRPSRLARFRQPLAWRSRLRYRRWFPWIFHLSALLFAAIHLHNFSMHHTPYWLMPLLVLPQWFTGLVLGWLRMRRGIGASILLHGLFNGGPLLVVWIMLHAMPQMIT
ncbi:CPBP family intramembrane glutamic endopeptidase [Paralcaligenes ureilyticus]|uniref:CAAX prenyl protease-like protein n=1 Tax=Paralcaligenes ureilyticus TaxID=627131 RepID=A0A4V2UZE0_9BURK|nr:CPBP family intramembrane glutamic endopeptidase [Paralcaligenes ureilyticus]TCT10968.1 CAAX prenyl protease-like protein [Paralcaligenes ureilyticus]